MRRIQTRAERIGYDPGGLRRGFVQLEKRTVRPRVIVVGDGVVHDLDLGRVELGDTSAPQGRNIVHDKVVEDINIVDSVYEPLLTAIDGVQTNAAAFTGSGKVALDQVAVDQNRAGALTQQICIQRRLAPDEEAAAMTGQALIKGLIEFDRVIGDPIAGKSGRIAFNSSIQTPVSHSGSMALREVTGNEVSVHPVTVGAGKKTYTTTSPNPAIGILGDHIVVDVSLNIL